ncbi:addiction module protein [Mycoplasmopsis bovis]|nr:addiction module protein [Mycoplasmopsis bovis]
MRANFETSVVSGREKVSHPTQKSLKLMEEIIKIHTNKNDLILDPFMGSGTTGVVSLKLKRKFIGIELDKNFFDIAYKRINDVD